LLVPPTWSVASSLLAHPSSMPASSSHSRSSQENSQYVHLPFDFKRVHSLRRERCQVLTIRRKDETASETNSTQDHVCNLTVLSLHYKAALRNFTNSLQYEQHEFSPWGCNICFQSAYTKWELSYVAVYIYIKCLHQVSIELRCGVCVCVCICIYIYMCVCVFVWAG
jgi:hypothetical protein